MVVESVSYKSNVSHTPSADCDVNTFTPTNGSAYQCPRDNFIEISIPVHKNGFLVAPSCRLNMTWKPAVVPATADATAGLNLYANQIGSAGLIQKIELYNGSALIEEIDHYNRAYAGLQHLYLDPYQTGGNACARDPAICPQYIKQYLDATTPANSVYETDIPATGVQIGNAVGKTTPTAGANEGLTSTIKCSLSLELSDLLGSASKKLLPMGLTNPYRLRIFLARDVTQVIHCYSADATTNVATTPASAVVNISDVSLTAKVITYDDETMDKMLASVGKKDGVLQWNGVQLRQSVCNTPFNSEVQAIVPNSQWSNLVGMTCFPYWNVSNWNGDPYGNFGNGTYQAQLQIDGKPFPQQYVGNGNSLCPETSLSELIISSVNCARPTCQIYSSHTQCHRTEQPSVSGGVYTTTAPAGTSNCNYLAYGIVPDAFTPSNSQLNAYPNSITSSIRLHSKVTPFFSYGFRLASTEHGKLEDGADTRGRQCVIHLRQANTLTGAGAGALTLVSQQVGVRYILDMNRGTIRVEM
jgi:hypothetical protein